LEDGASSGILKVRFGPFIGRPFEEFKLAECQPPQNRRGLQAFQYKAGEIRSNKRKMLFLFLVHVLTTRASSTPALPAVEYLNVSSSCKDIDNCRTILGIIWSCITTIILCTWVAIHPNIPEPVITQDMMFWDKCVHKISSLFGGKMLLLICALLVPEYILAWAIRQHLMARWIVKKHGTLSQLRAHAVT
jgi:hypothetical protein